jgi:ATP-dependent DNA ligase
LNGSIFRHERFLPVRLRSVKSGGSAIAPTATARPVFQPARNRGARSPGLPLPVTYPPMEARSVDTLPQGSGWQYEPKWDGFRCLAFRDGDDVDLRSKSGQPLARYFPDLVATLRRLPAHRFVLDGEIVVPVAGALSFEELQLRLHPAASRVARLAAAHPCRYIVFDLLVAADGECLAAKPLRERRAALERFIAEAAPSPAALALSPAVHDIAAVAGWREKVGLDGIMAKRLDLPYAAGERDAMVKHKVQRTADCVVGGFRYGSKSRLVGSLLLGLYDAAGKLNHIGFTASIAAADKPALTRRLEAIRGGAGFTGKAPGGPSRWSTSRSAEWQPVEPRLVVEVCYDHISGGRFRHGTRLLRWRPDKAPEQCRMEQIGL